MTAAGGTARYNKSDTRSSGSWRNMTTGDRRRATVAGPHLSGWTGVGRGEAESDGWWRHRLHRNGMLLQQGCAPHSPHSPHPLLVGHLIDRVERLLYATGSQRFHVHSTPILSASTRLTLSCTHPTQLVCALFAHSTQPRQPVFVGGAYTRVQCWECCSCAAGSDGKCMCDSAPTRCRGVAIASTSSPAFTAVFSTDICYMHCPGRDALTAASAACE